MSDLASLLSQLKIIQDQIKVIKDNDQTVCNICCDLKDDKMCLSCNQSVCTPCYSKLGSCPFCKDTGFGQLDDLQVQAELINHFYQNDDYVLEVQSTDQDDVEIYDHSDQPDDVPDEGRHWELDLRQFAQQHYHQQARLQARRQARQQVQVRPRGLQPIQELVLSLDRQSQDPAYIIEQDRIRVFNIGQTDLYGPTVDTTYSVFTNKRTFDVGSTRMSVHQTDRTLMVTIDDTKNFRIPLGKSNQQVRMYQNIKLTYCHMDSQDSYLLIDTPTCVGRYTDCNGTLRIKNK